MASGQSVQEFHCDCTATLKSGKAVNKHIKKTGHLQTRWCTLCCRLFGSAVALEQHKKTAARHRGNSYVPPKPSISNGKSRANNPNTAPVLPSMVTKAPTSTGVGTGKNKASQDTVKATSSSSNLAQSSIASAFVPQDMDFPNVVVLPDAVTQKYPWASRQNSTDLLGTLTAHCHTEDRLMSENYYMGGVPREKRPAFKPETFLPTPARVKGTTKRKAIAIDCEMVGVAGNRDELAQICAVDILTGEVLINTLVFPTEAVQSWRTKYSGVTRAKMTEARITGKTLRGWPAARQKVFEFADADTILVGHALNNDLKVLHIIHKRVVDSGILVAEAVFGKTNPILRHWGLKKSCQDLLGVTIQSSRKGHDCMEDTLATRELTLWCLKEREKLNSWGSKTLIQYEIEKRKRQERQEEEARKRALEKQKKEEELARKTMSPDEDGDDYGYEYDDDYGDDLLEPISWEEYLELIHYPPHYDPNWSD